MQGFRIVPDVEFNDDYMNAKKDLITAIKSISKLNPIQKEHLAKEVFGATYIETLMRAFSNANIQRWNMAASYKKLFKLLIDREMKSKDLAAKAGISQATLAKMKKDGATVSSDVLVKICTALNCTMDEIVEIVPAKED